MQSPETPIEKTSGPREWSDVDFLFELWGYSAAPFKEFYRDRKEFADFSKEDLREFKEKKKRLTELTRQVRRERLKSEEELTEDELENLVLERVLEEFGIQVSGQDEIKKLGQQVIEQKVPDLRQQVFTFMAAFMIVDEVFEEAREEEGVDLGPAFLEEF